MIVQVIGLPGSGKTHLATRIAKDTNAIHINADEVRADLSSDLGFSMADRIEQSRRLGAVARLFSSKGFCVIVDFINPTEATRKAFGQHDYSIWLNTITTSRYPDTDAIWETPAVDVTLNDFAQSDAFTLSL